MLAMGRENETAWECASELESTLVACFKLDMVWMCVCVGSGEWSGELDGWDVGREQKREKGELLGVG